ncbi:MAG: hypothetical protein ACI8PD_000781 [Nitrospinales bacterium]|jgi:uncharacterized protein (DUF1499 family)
MGLIFKTFFMTLVIFLLSACSNKTPSTIGKFAGCPDKPNCVSSKSTTSPHAIDPIYYKGSQEDARKSLLLIIKSLQRARLVSEHDSFLHVEFTSNLFRFVDDVEFYFKEPGIIHFRSASRIGHSDLGVNRERMEHIRQVFENDQ